MVQTEEVDIVVPTLGAVHHARTPAGPGPRSSDSQDRTATLTRLRDTALALFEERGFEATTADQVASSGGVSRRTFFRYYAAKEDVVFGDHAEQLVRLSELLEEGAAEPVRAAARALQGLVDHLVEDAPSTLRRARIIRATPALRDRETVWLQDYQQRIGAYLVRQERDPRRVMFAGVVAGALIAALRQAVDTWTASGCEVDPRALFAELADDIIDSMTPAAGRHDRPVEREVVVISTALSPLEIARLIEGART